MSRCSGSGLAPVLELALDRDYRPSGTASGESADSTELGLRVDVPGALSLAPRYRLDRSGSRHRRSELTTGRLAISASLPVVRALDVELEYRDRRELGADASGFAAVLKMRRPLALAERLPQGVMLDASVSWRESDATGRALWQDGFGGQIGPRVPALDTALSARVLPRHPLEQPGQRHVHAVVDAGMVVVELLAMMIDPELAQATGEAPSAVDEVVLIDASAIDVQPPKRPGSVRYLSIGG
ncbi:MAG: hypothetical protein U5R48_09045 [Gammaproteobacteria bacterium]|nr:hypothetical protein [Gammaproteobacteria bacterium]